MLTNSQLIRAFAKGQTIAPKGGKLYSNRLSIVGDILYSYAMPIAQHFGNNEVWVSNATRFLGGRPVSQTTSQHIGLALCELESRGYEVIIAASPDCAQQTNLHVRR